MEKAHEDFLLPTKLFCGKCERMMVGESGKSYTGARHYYYKCGNAKRRKGCDKKAVKKDWIECAVGRLRMERVLNEETISKIIDALRAMQEREDLVISITTAELQKPKLTREYMEYWLSTFRYGDPNDRDFQNFVLFLKTRICHHTFSPCVHTNREKRW